MTILPINLDDLIHARSVESIKIEYKATWDSNTEIAVCQTVCSFANDMLNLNGGYIILGIEEENGKPKLPPVGLSGVSLDEIQRRIRVVCKRIDPEYQPIIAPEVYMEKEIVVIWIPAGDNRPYNAPDVRRPKERAFYIRLGSESVKAVNDNLRKLIELTAKTPFDDRRNHESKVLDISPILVKRFLSEVKSDLLRNESPLPDEDLYKLLGIVKPEHDYLIPINCGLIFFSEHPEKFFQGCKFDIAQFGDDAGGNLIEEKSFTGPLNTQIEGVLDYLNNLTNIQLFKVPGKAKVERNVAYPYEALEEAIVNASYHRGYDNSYSEPNKVYLYPDRMEIISYPGPVSGIQKEHFIGTRPLPPVPARNRRIGSFLKELRLAEMRGTGIPKIKRTMSENGSPEPIIEFDEDRTYFKVILPAHPRYVVVHALREGAYLWSIGDKKGAINILQNSFNIYKNSGAVAGQLIDNYYYIGEYDKADEIFQEFKKLRLSHESTQPYIRYFKALFSDRKYELAKKTINGMPESIYDDDIYEVAIAFKRVEICDKAHTLLSKLYSSYDNNPDYLENYAEVKLKIADINYKSCNRNWAVMRRLRSEAIELLNKAISLYTDKNKRAWSWFNLARALQFNRALPTKVEEAYTTAMKLLPDEKIFKTKHRKWREFCELKSIDFE